MSLHRVLPLPPALSDRSLAQRWGVGPDSLEGARIMVDRKSATPFNHNPHVTTPPHQKSSSPTDGRHHSHSISPGQESLEEYESPESTHHPTPSARERPGSVQEGSASSICLCQPDPKVPRPRNAFILYRQHYQATVVAQNPGLANPQISKVIGDHWRNAPDDIKNHWKLLAEEEKARHQKQYPGYRYQPRKSNRTNSVSSTLTSSDSTSLPLTRCAKCGGRSISSSTMMSVTAGNQQVNHAHRAASTSYSPSRTLTTPVSNPSAARLIRGIGSPLSNQAPPSAYRYLPQQAGGKPLPLTSPHSKRPDPHELAQHSPDAKRRRVANSVAFVPVRGPTGPLSPLAFPPHHQRRQSLPRLDSLGPPNLYSPFTMGPPPRQHHHNRSEKSLTLAPLQQTSASGNTSVHANAADTQAKSLEAMILSIPILNKIKVLARISAPLASSPPSSPTAPTTATASSASAATVRDQTGKRGLVIAIDAAEPLALRQLTRTLAYALHEHDVKVIPTPHPPEDMEPSFQSYLRLVDEYHTLSAQIKAHITSPPPSTPAKPLPNNSRNHFPTDSTTKNNNDGDDNDNDTANDAPDSPVSPKSFPKPPQRSRDKPNRSRSPSSPAAPFSSSSASRSSSSEEESDNDNEATTTTPARLPIALVPAWQLTHTDAFACSVDIADRYSPIDHWQWGATVWRGVIGADVTVAVRAGGGEDSPLRGDWGGNNSGSGGGGIKGGERERDGGRGPGGKMASGQGGSAGVSRGGNGSGSGGGGGQGARDAGVEVRLDDARAVVVRGEDGGGVAEGGLRRVGFEVGEWVRGWADREEEERRRGRREGSRGV